MSIFRVRMAQGDSRSGSGNMDAQSRRVGTITAASNASPIVITGSSHGLTSGTRVTVQDVAGNTAANGDWVITYVSADTFSLNGSTGNAAYTSGGTWRVDSLQRTMYAMGPNKINRKLKDGQQFTDCNYWKRFVYPTVPYSESFIEVVSDDGSVYVDGVTSNFVRTYTKTILASTTHTTTNNIIDVIGDNGAPAQWAVFTCTGDDLTIRLNSLSTSDFNINAGTTVSFNQGDVLINRITIDNSDSGKQLPRQSAMAA